MGPGSLIIHLTHASSRSHYLVSRATREGKPWCVSTFQFSACFTLASVPLDKANSIAKAKGNVGGDTGRHIQITVVTVTAYCYSSL